MGDGPVGGVVGERPVDPADGDLDAHRCEAGALELVPGVGRSPGGAEATDQSCEGSHGEHGTDAVLPVGIAHVDVVWRSP
jgi:hypothetical protein